MFFITQPTAYEIPVGMEFRRALSRSGLIQAARVRVGERFRPVVVAAVTLPETPSKLRAWPNLPATQAVPPSRLPALPLPEVGRASCTERAPSGGGAA